MIQRRQTIFMFLTAIVSSLLFFVALISLSNDETTMRFTIFGMNNPIESEIPIPSTWPLVVMAVLLTALPVFTALIYKKRELQVKLCYTDMILNIVFLVLEFYYYSTVASIASFLEIIWGNPLDVNIYGMSIPVINIILLIFAVRGVKKDIELLKSVDRLR